jgi:hypothetical protein
MAKSSKSGGLKLSEIPDSKDDSDAEDIDSQEVAIMNEIFKTDARSSKYNTMRYIFYATALFIILSIPFTDRIIELAFPMAQSWLVLVGAKSIAFFLAYYVIVASTLSAKR